MLKTRFDGTEETSMDKALKLAGKKNQVAQSVLYKLLFHTCPYENIYLCMIDRLGLYGDRIELLFIACGYNIANFVNTVNILFKKEVSQDRIIAMKTQEEFDNLVEDYQ